MNMDIAKLQAVAEQLESLATSKEIDLADRRKPTDSQEQVATEAFNLRQWAATIREAIKAPDKDE